MNFLTLRGCGAGLLLEASKAFGVRSKLLPQHLNGDVPPQLEVLRSVDFAHTPRTKALAYLVVT